MRALLMVEPGRQEIDDIPVPEVAPGWALIRVVASSAGLFHTQMVKGMLDTAGFPRILGHEIVGEVVEARSPASPPPGTLVVADAVVGCGVCEWCVRGDESVCPWMRPQPWIIRPSVASAASCTASSWMEPSMVM